MAKKLIEPHTNRLTGSLENHARREPKPTFHGESTHPSVMSFLSWIAPPIGVDMSGIDTVNPHYKVSIMTVGSSSGGPILVLPFAEPIAWYPMAAPSIQLQYQLTSTLPGDPTIPDFYDTMTVSQISPGVLTIRSRVFLTPRSTAFANVTTSTATTVSPPIIQVSGVVNSFNQEITVFYEHFLPADTYGPTDLYLQQPW
jgi:hypothetical protein